MTHPTNIACVDLVMGCSKGFFPPLTLPTPALAFLTPCKWYETPSEHTQRTYIMPLVTSLLVGDQKCIRITISSW